MSVTLVEGEPGADPDIRILLPESAVPWAGHSGRYAVHQVMAQIAKNRTTIIFCNTRGLAELIFQELWKVNDLSAFRDQPRQPRPRSPPARRARHGRRGAPRAQPHRHT